MKDPVLSTFPMFYHSMPSVRRPSILQMKTIELRDVTQLFSHVNVGLKHNSTTILLAYHIFWRLELLRWKQKLYLE